MLKEDIKQLESAFAENVCSLLKKSLIYKHHFDIKAVIGITLDDEQEFHFCITEKIPLPITACQTERNEVESHESNEDSNESVPEQSTAKEDTENFVKCEEELDFSDLSIVKAEWNDEEEVDEDIPDAELCEANFLQSEEFSEILPSSSYVYNIQPEEANGAPNFISKNSNTLRATRAGVRIFRDFLAEKHLNVNFESISNADLDASLQRFYVEARNKNGELYKKNTITAIKHSLNRYLQQCHGSQFDIIKGPDFIKSNLILKAVNKELKKYGKDVDHKDAISEGDLIKMYNYFDIDNAAKLQHKVFVDLVLHWACRGRSSLRWLRSTDFTFGVDVDGSRFIHMKREGLIPESDEQELVEWRLYEVRGHPLCPVVSFEKYISKLSPESEWLFQQVRIPWSYNMDTWFTKCPIGKNTIGKMMAVISEAAGLSTKYTNHCLRRMAYHIVTFTRSKQRHVATILGKPNGIPHTWTRTEKE